MEKLMKSCSNYTSFLFCESEKTCYITIYNKDKCLMETIVSEEEGGEILLDYCNYYHGKLIPSFDTIGIEVMDVLQGFVRYEETPRVIKNSSDNLISTFLYQLLIILQNQTEQTEIECKYWKYEGSYEISIFGSNKDKCFHLLFDIVDLNLLFPNVIEQYLIEHEQVYIQAIENDPNYVILDRIKIPYEYLSYIQKCYLNIQLSNLTDMQKCFYYYLYDVKLSEKDKTSYKRFLNSTNGKRIINFLEESKEFVYDEDMEEMVLGLVKPRWIE